MSPSVSTISAISRVALQRGWGLFLRILRRPFLPRFPRKAEHLLDDFRSDDAISAASYEHLFHYFALGWRTFRTQDRSGAAYRGLPSWSGRQVDALEGFSRVMPLFGAWVHGGRPPRITLPADHSLSLPEEFRRGLLAGTDPASDAYWGEMPGKSNQRIVEAADIALALWFFREEVWSTLSDAEANQVVAWLALVDEAPGLDNNWHLFFVIIDRVLAALGRPGTIASAEDHYARIKAFHLGDGWFEDGPDGPIDYYNAWGFHYALYWIDQIDPEWDPGFIRTAQRTFLSTYKYLLGPEGFPVLGRSICYRMAAAAPYVFGQVYHPDVVSPGMARRALDCTWRYFIRHGAVARGNVTQGYFGRDGRLLDNYSGPASCLWSLRSLVAAFALSQNKAFWQASPEPLPVEQDSYDVHIHGPNWRVRGEKRTAGITVELLEHPEGATHGLQPYTWKARLRSTVAKRPWRPDNERAKYQQRHYSSRRPLGS